MTDIAIRIENLSKCYHVYDAPHDRLKQFVLPRLQHVAGQTPRQYFREFWALNDVSFEVRKGETVGIIGRNGSGKSTLLQLICGTLNPTSGKVETYGRIAALLELGSGFNRAFTGRENVYMNASLLGLTKEEIDSRFGDIADFADIGEFINRPVKTYSSGMMVRLAFSVAINVDPEILIVDEALSVGDELFQRKCFSRIESIRANGATILFASHSGNTIVELCDRVVLLDSGEKLVFGLPKQTVGRYQKLIYAPADKRNGIREHIRNSDDRAIEAIHEGSDGLPENQSDSLITKEELERFDPNLKPTSTIEYESNGALIESPVVLTLSGNRVNNLVRGKIYRYSFTVRFIKSANNVRFGMLIKSATGVELGGAESALSIANAIQYVAANKRFRVEFLFNANLNAGIYFMNAGVLGQTENQNDGYLHRLVDIAMFRILPDEDNYATAMVDFNCVPDIEEIEV